MTRLRLLASFASVILTSAVLAAQAPSPTASDLPKVEFEKYTLPNGLQVILHVDRKLPIVHVNVVPRRLEKRAGWQDGLRAPF